MRLCKAYHHHHLSRASQTFAIDNMNFKSHAKRSFPILQNANVIKFHLFFSSAFRSSSNEIADFYVLHCKRLFNESLLIDCCALSLTGISKTYVVAIKMIAINDLRALIIQ